MILLQLSTSNAGTSETNRLRYTLRNPIHLSGQICLGKINLWYNWNNITADLGNNSLTYKKTGGPLRTITLPDGSYTVRDINNYLHLKMEVNKDHIADKPERSNERYGINLYSNTTYNRISIKIASKFTLTIGSGLAKTLGAETTAYSNTTTNFPNIPLLENVESVNVHCNLVYNEHQSESNLLYSFTPLNSYGSLLSIEPSYPQWQRTRGTTEHIIEIWLTDQDNKPLPLEDKWGVILQLAD